MAEKLHDRCLCGFYMSLKSVQLGHKKYKTIFFIQILHFLTKKLQSPGTNSFVCLGITQQNSSQEVIWRQKLSET